MFWLAPTGILGFKCQLYIPSCCTKRTNCFESTVFSYIHLLLLKCFTFTFTITQHLFPPPPPFFFPSSLISLDVSVSCNFALLFISPLHVSVFVESCSERQKQAMLECMSSRSGAGQPRCAARATAFFSDQMTHKC